MDGNRFVEYKEAATTTSASYWARIEESGKCN